MARVKKTYGGAREGAGRPIESPDGTRRKERRVRFSEAEWAAVKVRAAELGVSAAEYLRRRTLKGLDITP